MLFKKVNEEIDIENLSNFIETPSQNCNEEECKEGVDKILVVLEKNPSAIMQIIMPDFPHPIKK